MANEWSHQLNQAEIVDLHRTEVFICRSVDKRLILCSTQNQRLRIISQEFMHLSFCGSTIQLETVANHKFLGLFQLPITPVLVAFLRTHGALDIPE